ncbi:MAG: L,D-transpeptidase family protein [Clostridium fessum]
MHCPKRWNNTGTSGCISIPEEDMKQVVRQVDAGTKIVVVQDEADLANY